MIANAADAASLERGGHDDPQYGNRFLYSPVHVTRTIADGEVLRLGGVVLTAHSTPGHTKGNTTWTWKSCENKRCLDMVFVGSLSAPAYKLIDNQKYPNIVQDFEHSFKLVEALPCDIALAPHPGMVEFWERLEAVGQRNRNVLIDPSQCQAYSKYARASFEAELTNQRMNPSSEK